MKVSTRAHYGLRAMTELAAAYEQGLLPLSEIARSEQLPLAYLEQLIAELRRAGLVEGIRGVHGGYRLARHPDEITVGDIYRVLEGPIAPVDCTAVEYLPGSCVVEESCLSRSVWARVRDSIESVLDSTSLEDLRLEHAATAGPSVIPLEALRAVGDEQCVTERAHR
ncbi:MAG TPA: Rrf2 family transcriptional regulator [Chloroflexota bacterium]|nr:Rrf2 family transcriptional regulator [Chloroflexota bacterium]